MILALSSAATIASIFGIIIAAATAVAGVFYRGNNTAQRERVTDLEADLARAKQRHVDDKAELQQQMHDQELTCQREIAELRGALDVMRGGLVAQIGRQVGLEVIAAIKRGQQ